MKYSVKLLLANHKPNKHKQYPIYLRVTIASKSSYLSTGHYIVKAMWDEKNERVKDAHPEAHLWNPEITHKKQEVIRKLVGLQIKGKSTAAAEIKTSFEKNLTNIFEFVEQFKIDVAGKRKDPTLKNYTKHLKKLEDFHGSKNLTFEEITSDYLIKYEAWLRTKVGNNYTHKLLTTLRSFFNAAISKKLIDCYPFKGEYEFPVYKSPIKDYLTIQELKAWEKYIPKIKNPVIKESAIYFLFACYCGFRISDWFSEKNINGNSINLRTTKGKGSDVYMPISAPLRRILKILPPLSIEEATINEKIKIVAGKIGIEKHITAHTARHTFAVTVCLGNKISSETAAKLMGITLKTFVDNYSQVTQEKIEKEALAAWKALK